MLTRCISLIKKKYSTRIQFFNRSLYPFCHRLVLFLISALFEKVKIKVINNILPVSIKKKKISISMILQPRSK